LERIKKTSRSIRESCDRDALLGSCQQEQRRRLEEIHVCALECYAAVALGVGGSELPPGERSARELAAIAPYRERGHALLMEILTARGNGAEALRIYEQLRQRLRDELGATPAPELRELQERLLRR
jgi:DNA-binding SARP family transcriptional activator